MKLDHFLLAAAIAVVTPAFAQDHGDHGAKKAVAAPGAGSAPVDRDKVWKESLAKQPLAATATFDSQGRLWLAKIQGGHLTVSVSDDRGQTFSAPAIVNPETENIAADGENRPKILVAKSGNIYVAWTRSLEKPMTGHIRFSRSLDGGKTFSAPVTVNDDRELISHRFDAMAVTDHGEIYIAWLDKRDLSAAQKTGEKYSGAATYYAVSDDNGASFRPNVKAADHSCECCRVAIAVDVDDIPVIAWRHIFDDKVRDHALLKLDGKSAPMRLSTDNWEVNACPHHGPALVIGDDGTYHAVWFSNAPKRQGLFYAYSTNAGKNFSEPLGFGNPDAQPSHPYVLAFRKAVYIAWKEFDGRVSKVRVMTSSDGGKSWGEPRMVAVTAGASDHPFLIRDGEKPYVAWNTAKDGFRLIGMPAR